MSDSYQRIRQSLEPAYSEQEIRENWQRIEDRQGPVKVRRSMFSLAAVGSLAVATTAAVVFFLLGDRVPSSTAVPNLTAVDSRISLESGSTVGDGVKRIALSDGSALALEENAKLTVIGNEGSRFVTQLQRGKVHFNVKPRGPRTWEIETGIATVEVVGTEFDVNVDDNGLAVTVSRGVVLVRGERVPGRVVRLTAGMSIQVQREPLAAAQAPMSASQASQASTAVKDIKIETTEPSRASAPKSLQPSLQVTPPAVTSPAMAIAPATISTASTAEAAMPDQPRTLQMLLREVDALRVTDSAAAIALLSSQIEGFRNDASYGVAAFTLGRITLDAKQYAKSVVAFERVIANGRPVSLVQDAQARRVESMLRGKMSAASAELKIFIESYPVHPRRARLEKLAAQVNDSP